MITTYRLRIKQFKYFFAQVVIVMVTTYAKINETGGSNMSKSNLEIIRSTYEGSTSSNAKHLAEALSEKAEWTEAEGFPYGGTYIGVEAIMENVFSRLGSEWDDYKASVNTYHEVNGKDVIIAEGIYSGVYKKTGKSFEAEFVHVWQLENGKIVKFKQYVDSHIVREAMKS
ncbi:hypothetical protein bthur0007_7400 [Bacillus thuringiensis serovar monterrey BGSC 4AJ1]|nr:hypothetical protein bthur0007_7400 [Bacillus thuringiensis serovar monterrey BGSC 4AJ1]SME06403.1 SnoaL-like domain protein [Bacillus cereus]